MSARNEQYLGWLSILRLGLVMSSIGAIVVLTTSTLNRVMVVELALAASLPAALVAWHYAVQLSRPRWGYGSDMGARRTPWIAGGMGVLALGAILATDATVLMHDAPVAGIALAIFAFTLIGAGVGAAGTSLLALLATHVAPARRPAAAATTWIMMIAGIVVTAATAGSFLDPFSFQRLALVASCVAGIAFLVTLLAIWGVERRIAALPSEAPEDRPAFRTVLAEIWSEDLARNFTVFVFVAMLAYSMQELILEPFAGLIFAYTPGQSTQLSGTQNAGVLIGMILVGAAGSLLGGHSTRAIRLWTVGGCLGSAAALCALAIGGTVGPGWPLQTNVFLLGFANGVFAVAAIGSMMTYAGAGRARREGVRMGIWGASQAMAFGLGGFLGALGVDVLRALTPDDASAFFFVFAAEGALFVGAALLAARLANPGEAAGRRLPAMPAEGLTPVSGAAD